MRRRSVSTRPLRAWVALGLLTVLVGCDATAGSLSTPVGEPGGACIQGADADRRADTATDPAGNAGRTHSATPAVGDTGHA